MTQNPDVINLGQQIITPPSMATVIVGAIEAELLELHTGLPAKVLSFDPTTQSCSVQPLLQRVLLDAYTGDVQPLTLPPIDNVPIQYPGGSGWVLTFPLAPGDIVYLSFCERSIDDWLSTPDGSQPTTPFFARRHDLSDAIAIPSLRVRNQPMKTLDSTHLTLGREDGSCMLQLDPSGNINVTGSAINLNAGAQADSAMVRGTDLQTWLQSLVTYIQTLTLPVTSPASAGPPVAPVPPLPATLLSLAAKVK
jgi:hypothetical protein